MNTTIPRQQSFPRPLLTVGLRLRSPRRPYGRLAAAYRACVRTYHRRFVPLAAVQRAFLGLSVLFLSCGCVPPPGSEADRAMQKLWGVPTQEEQAYCRTVQNTYLQQSPPAMPPSCSEIVKAGKAQPAVQP